MRGVYPSANDSANDGLLDGPVRFPFIFCSRVNFFSGNGSHRTVDDFHPVVFSDFLSVRFLTQPKDACHVFPFFLINQSTRRWRDMTRDV